MNPENPGQWIGAGDHVIGGPTPIPSVTSTDTVTPTTSETSMEAMDQGHPPTPATATDVDTEPFSEPGESSESLTTPRYLGSDPPSSPSSSSSDSSSYPTSVSGDQEEEEEEEDEDGTDTETEGESGEGDKWVLGPAKCLFCPIYYELSEIMAHMLEIHDFSMERLVRKYRMDQMSYIKMVNWVRDLGKHVELVNIKEDPDPKMVQAKEILLLPEIPELEEPHSPVPPIWLEDKWLKSTEEDDMLLVYCVNDDEEFNWDNEDKPGVIPDRRIQIEHIPISASESGETLPAGSATGPYYNPLCPPKDLHEVLSIIKSNPATLPQSIRQKTVELIEERMWFLVDQDNQMKAVMARLMEPMARRISLSEDDVPLPKEEEYFESYDGLDIHAEMLKDAPRTLAYQRAILNNSADFKDKYVLDLGCGTGILSMFSADAGSKLVYAVDVSKMIYDAMDICFENDKEGMIKFFARKLESMNETEMEKIDILISEFMGYFLLFEGMTNSYIFARDKFLKPGGQMYPNTAAMYLVALSDEDGYMENVEKWGNMYGYKMSTLKSKVLGEAHVINVSDAGIVSEELVLKTFDLHTVKVDELPVDVNSSFTITKTCSLTGICGYFSVGFQDGRTHQEVLSTAPGAPPTHWKQVLFYLPERMPVTEGEQVGIHFTCKPHAEFERWLQIDFEIGKHKCSFAMK